MPKINVSFVMYAGLSYGGAHRQAMTLAKNLDKNKFNVRYFWCKHKKDLYSDFVFPEISLDYLQDLKDFGVETVEFFVNYRDISQKYHPWCESNFFEVFSKYETDIVFSACSGNAEFPFVHLNLPVIDWNVFGGVDSSENKVFSVAVSKWVHDMYISFGGNPVKSDICYAGVDEYISEIDLRDELGISKNSIVVGFHQRVDDKIYAEYALRAWKKLEAETDLNVTFIIMGGSSKYKTLSESLSLPVIFLDTTFLYKKVSHFLNTLDIFSHSAGLGESAGNALQEAMYHGVPVVSRIGINNGHLDVIGNTIDVASTDKVYYEILHTLVTNDSIRKKVGKKSKDRANDKFSTASMTVFFEKLFEKIDSLHSKPYKFNVVPLDVYQSLTLRTRLYRLMYKFPGFLLFSHWLYGKIKRIVKARQK